MINSNGIAKHYPTLDKSNLIDAEKLNDECFSLIFHLLDKESIVNCMLTCRRFEKILSNDSFWVNHARYLDVQKVLPSLKWRRAVAQKKINGDQEVDISKFNFNLKRMFLSGRGYSVIHPNFMSHFETNPLHGILRSGDIKFIANGSGIRMEPTSDDGCEPHPDVKQCFASSCSRSSISVFIDLVASGIDPWVLDHVRPKIRITQKVNHRHDCAATLSFCGQLNYHEAQWLVENGNVQTSRDTDHPRFKSKKKSWPQWDANEWEDWSLEFDDYPSGIRHLTVMNEGNDDQFWAGFYGPKIANLEIQVILPEEPIIKKLEEDKERRQEDNNPINQDVEMRRGFHFEYFSSDEDTSEDEETSESEDSSQEDEDGDSDF